MDIDLQDRVAALEENGRRFRLATTGDEGWENWLQARLLDEREFLNDMLAHLIAQFHRQILGEVAAMLDQKLAQRVCGTYDEKQSYRALDLVVRDGGSFIARRDNPGACPGDGWQLMARQGQRGVRGERGERGQDAPTLDRWLVDRAAFTVTPVYSNGIFGPALELRELFQQLNGAPDGT